MILSARAVRRTGYGFRCDECGRYLDGLPSIYLYGMADDLDKPGPLRLCPDHCSLAWRAEYPGVEKLRTALAALGRTEADQ